MPTLVKTLSLIFQQECEFSATFHFKSQDSIVNLAFNEGHSKKFHIGFFSSCGWDALLGMVATILNTVTIVTKPISNLSM